VNFLNRIHPERNLDNFVLQDGTVSFFSLVRAVALRIQAKNVLDFGAGRGAFQELNNEEQGSLLRRHLQDLRFEGARVTACDVDSAVLGHPCSHEQVQIEVGKPLPFDDDQFDLIVSDWTFEHIEDAEGVAKELSRVVRPGGYICARTPNATGYVRICSQLVPNRLHTDTLSRVQPGRKERDIFPTVYKMNSARAVKKLFPNFDVFSTQPMTNPSYYFGNELIYRFFLLLHRVLPRALAPTIFFFMKKK